MKRKLVRTQHAGTVYLALALLLSASAPSQAQQAEKSFADMVSKVTLIPSGEPDSEMMVKATEAIHFIQTMDLKQASRSANAALQLDARNAYLHFLNGFIYHLQARQGDSQKNEIAIEGYQQSLRIDPSNWIAQEFLGLAYMDLKKFDQAKDQFSEVLLMQPDSTVAVYGMMVASYLMGDAVTACTMADQYRKIAPTPNIGFIRSSVAVYASCANFDQAELMRQEFGKRDSAPADLNNIDRRVAQWKSFYRKTRLAPEPTDSSSAATIIPANLPVPATAPVAQTDDTAPKMVLVDVVLVSSQELISTSKGINLLNALTLQLGSVNAPAYSESRQFDTASSGSDSTSSRITRAVTIPALAYSLNIANANNSTNEVLARPTLAAMEGMPSEFFSGTNLSAGVLSASSLGSPSVIPVDKRFGVKLAVTPVFLPNGRIQMKVDAERTSLNSTSDNPKVAYQLEIAETTTSANVVMQMGDTLVLSGLSEKITASARDGVPFMQDIPVVQYLFSNKKTNEVQRSVLILITPRVPAYTSKVAKPDGSVANANTLALREKFGFSGPTTSTVESILQHLSNQDFFREFRQGDVTLERWDRMQTTGERLRQALGFLYY